jgi:MOSC domain-containing protein YiiM
LSATVVAVARSKKHGFSKTVVPDVNLLAGLGVEHDAHAGASAKHLSRITKWPTRPNLRQVHLIHEELFDELHLGGFAISAGALGENITTRGIALLDLPRGARLGLGPDAVIEVTGLRNPCAKLDKHQPGLMRACLGRGPDGEPIRKVGVMATVARTGVVRAGDPIRIELPGLPHARLRPV